MLRSILAVLAGYIVMVIAFFVAFSAAYRVLGADSAFQPGTFIVSPLWLALSVIISFFGAIPAGYICAAMSKSKRACQALAVIVFVLGMLLCIPALREDPAPRPRTGEVSNLQAMQQAQGPAWMHLLSPVLGAAGVLFGSRMKMRSASP